MTGFMDDPTGRRPDNPDFWMLSDLVLQLDGRMAEAKGDVAEVFVGEISQECNLESLVYLASQRSMRAAGVETSVDLVAKMDDIQAHTALYVEGFVMGSRFAKRRAEKNA